MLKPRLSFRIYLGLFIISAATLSFEISLTRIFSVAQFYHFAFMIVSIALLGYGASGSVLSILPDQQKYYAHPLRSLGWLAIGTSFSILFSYLLINWLPFDSFSIFVDRKQIAILVLHYLALALPFFFNGFSVGFLLTTYPNNAGRIYSANLIGSASGCIIALAIPVFLSGEGIIVLSCGLAGIAAVICLINTPVSKMISLRLITYLGFLSQGMLLAIVLVYIFLRINTTSGLNIFQIKISPYKSLSYAMQYPNAEIVFQRWNSFSRVDIVRSEGIRSSPGLSIRYTHPPPPEDGLFIDGDELSPIIRDSNGLDFVEYMPSAVAFHLRPGASTLILEPRGGLDIHTALELGADRVTAIEGNQLIVDALKELYETPRVTTIVESDRSYVRRTKGAHDIVIISLINSFHPVRSGAYSLVEDYRYTVEAFRDTLRQLNQNGILVVNRWLQNPPSESLRIFATAITALESEGIQPENNIVTFRGYNTVTFLIKKVPFTTVELNTISEYAAERAFDLVYMPGITEEQVNKYTILPEAIYAQSLSDLINSNPRDDFYKSYQYDVSPPTDNKPFPGHYFKWSQLNQMITELGKFWQPFGGAGYLVVLALLTLSAFLSAVFILVPVWIAKYRTAYKRSISKLPRNFMLMLLIYFGMLGLGYLLVEIPLIQKFILYLGHPAYAVTTVLFTMLLFSGIGSQISERIPLKIALLLLICLLIGSLLLLPFLFENTLGLPLEARFAIAVFSLAPLGLLMGMPFPKGIQKLSKSASSTAVIPWVWAVNGSASVIAAILANLLALSWGFNFVLLVGTLCYTIALIMAVHRAWERLPEPSL